MGNPRAITKQSIDTLLSGATPQFSQQLKVRLWDMIRDLPEGDEVRQYGEAQFALLDEIAFGTTRGTGGPGRPSLGSEGWASLPSHPAGS